MVITHRSTGVGLDNGAVAVLEVPDEDQYELVAENCTTGDDGQRPDDSQSLLGGLEGSRYTAYRRRLTEVSDLAYDRRRAGTRTCGGRLGCHGSHDHQGPVC